MMENAQQIMEKSKACLDYMVELRRKIHSWPELSFEEFETSRIVKEELTAMGIPWTAAAGTGVVGLIEGDLPGRVLVLRADMDALPVQEETGLPYASRREGIMHACGHDGHTACLLGISKILQEMRHELPGTVKLMFQPSEEAVPGARKMVEEGVLENPRADYAIAFHVKGCIPKGEVAVRYGGVMAAPDQFKFRIKACGGHGSTPYNCTDVIALACQAVSLIYETVNRKVGQHEPSAVSVCSIHAGNCYNVLPGEVTAVGTIRTYDVQVRRKIVGIIDRVLQSVTSLGDAEYELKVRDDIDPVVNDRFVTDCVRAAAEKIVGPDHVRVLQQGFMGGDDFSFVSREIPSCYFHAGIMENDEEIVHHSSTFAWDDGILDTCAAVMVRAVFEILGRA